MTTLHSEYRLLSHLQLNGRENMKRADIYKACVGVASSGGCQEAEEATLAPVEVSLLEARREIHSGKIESARARIETVLASEAEVFYRAEAMFLRATLHHGLGEFADAGQWYDEAAKGFAACSENYRELRARINGIISRSNTLDRYLSGELYAIEQEARRREFYDLVGHIQRGRANEWMAAGDFTQAASELEEAIKSYELDGFPADLAVARAMLAICQLLLGDTEAARLSIQRVAVREGKVKTYMQIYDELAMGKTPQLDRLHPLSDTPWKAFDVKRSSVPGKILQLLVKGPASRDTLIDHVWGSAPNPSYTSRLYTAISSLKRSGKVKIVFDGENYQLLS